MKQDYAKAIKWYRKAVKQGNSLAQDNLKSLENHQNYYAKKKVAKSEYSNGSGGNDFLEGLAMITVGIVAYNTLSGDDSSTNNDSSQTAQENNTEYNECYNQAVDRIGYCKLVPQFNCNAVGCPEDKIKCYESNQGSDCPIDSGVTYYKNLFGLDEFYCDTENARNHDTDINVVIKKICLNK